MKILNNKKYEEKFYWFFILSICHLGGKGHRKPAAQMIRLKKVTSRQKKKITDKIKDPVIESIQW